MSFSSDVLGSKTVLVIGSGAREHALAWKLSQSPQVKKIIIAPGNPGMPSEWERWPVSLADGKASFEKLAIQAKAGAVDLVVVGPDNPLAEGIVDVLSAAGLAAFGPSGRAAQIEASKAFAKDVMKAAGVPTAAFQIAESADEALGVLKGLVWIGFGWVIKADGLALGKGVHVCETLEQALNAVEELSRITQRFIIEERLSGEELSWMAFCEGESCSLLEPARDYKRLLDHDEGPNTGGMGAFSPIPQIPSNLAERVRNEVFIPTLQEMKKRGAEFRGLLYAGLMWNRKTDQLWVLEFNARFGDPEAQVLVARMEGDFYSWCEAVALGRLALFPQVVPFKKDYCVYVVAAAGGYPAAPENGKEIKFKNPESIQNLPVFFAGVREKEGHWVTQGGRVLGVLAHGESLSEAREKAYLGLKTISFEGMQYRNDIGKLEAV